MNGSGNEGERLQLDALNGLASPFLNEEFFTEKTEEEQGSRLIALEADSPFAQDLILVSELLVESEYDEGFASEHESPYIDDEVEELIEDENEDIAWEENEYEDTEYEARDIVNEPVLEFDLDVAEYDNEEVLATDNEISEDELTSEDTWIDFEEHESVDLEDNRYQEDESFLDEVTVFDSEEDEFYWEVLESEQNPAIPAAIAEFAVSFGKDWSQRRKGNPTAEDITQWLLLDYQDTLTGAQLRWGSKFGKGKFSIDAIGRAWMVSRQENMKFQLLSTSFKVLKYFHPPKSKVSLVTSNLIEGSDIAPVASVLVQFVQTLHHHYPSFHASTYRGHGGGSFHDRGFSTDLFLQDMDSRGFYQVDNALKFLRALHETAVVVNADWRVIYNDFSVAKVINQETGQYHVIYVGKARKDNRKKVTGLNWHGPDPLILHFHLDLVPLSGNGDISLPPASSSKSTPKPTTGSIKPPAELVRFAQRVLNATESERLDDDGDLGSLTSGALVRFRRKYNLGPGSTLDSKTELALVQRALEEIRKQSLFGQYGVLDAATRDAINDFKSTNGLPVDASFDATTRSALTKILFEKSRKSISPSTPQPITNAGKVSKKGGKWGGWVGRQTIPIVKIKQSNIKNKYDLAVAIAAVVETGGYFDKVQMYDKGILSWGIKQWTLHRGSLQEALVFIKNSLIKAGNGSLWFQSFPGIDVSRSQIVVNNISYTTPQRDNDKADLALRKIFRGSEIENRFDEKIMDHWLDIFALAGRQPYIQNLQFEYAVLSLRKNLDRSLGVILKARKEIDASKVGNYRRVGDYIENSTLAISLFNGMETQNPKWAYLYLKKIVDRFSERYRTYDLSKWPSNWQILFADELKQEFEESGVACWGRRAIQTKSSCKGRTSRTEKILEAFSELSKILA